MERRMWGLWKCGCRRQSLTIDVEAVRVQRVGTQPGDTTGQPAQLLVQPLSVQPGAHGVRAVGADGIHSSGRPILLGPGGGGGGGNNRWSPQAGLLGPLGRTGRGQGN